MVYLGKPSTGCNTCRQRRIKCDETRPTCEQCTKSRRKCTGSKTSLDVNWHYWHHKRIGKQGRYLKEPPAIPQNQEKIRPAVSPTSDIEASQSQIDSFLRLPQNSQALQLSLQERANAYFISAFVPISLDQELVGFTGFINLLDFDREPLYYQLAFEACAMAAYTKDAVDANCYNRLTITKYNSALQAIHAALENQVMVCEDATLASILLLALFECIKPTARQHRTWCWHIMGAVSLAKDRICKQDVKQIECSLFVAIRTQMIFYSLITLKDADEDEFWWPQDNATYEYTFLQKLCAEASSLGAKSKAFFKGPRYDEHSRELIRGCLAQEKKCRDWWEHHFVDINHQKKCGHENIGSDHNQLWLFMLQNMLLYARILLHSIIIRCIACIHLHKTTDYRTTKEYAQAFAAMQNLISDSIAIENYQREEMSVPGLRGYSMVWPLIFISSMNCLTECHRITVGDQLQRIGKYFGVCCGERGQSRLSLKQ